MIIISLLFLYCKAKANDFTEHTKNRSKNVSKIFQKMKKLKKKYEQRGRWTKKKNI